MENDNKLLQLREVESLVSFKKSKIYTLIENGDFPAPVKIGTRSVRWKANDIQKWIQKLNS